MPSSPRRCSGRSRSAARRSSGLALAERGGVLVDRASPAVGARAAPRRRGRPGSTARARVDRVAEQGVPVEVDAPLAARRVVAGRRPDVVEDAVQRARVAHQHAPERVVRGRHRRCPGPGRGRRRRRPSPWAGRPAAPAVLADDLEPVVDRPDGHPVVVTRGRGRGDQSRSEQGGGRGDQQAMAHAPTVRRPVLPSPTRKGKTFGRPGPFGCRRAASALPMIRGHTIGSRGSREVPGARRCLPAHRGARRSGDRGRPRPGPGHVPRRDRAQPGAHAVCPSTSGTRRPRRGELVAAWGRPPDDAPARGHGDGPADRCRRPVGHGRGRPVPCGRRVLRLGRPWAHDHPGHSPGPGADGLTEAARVDVRCRSASPVPVSMPDRSSV